MTPNETFICQILLLVGVTAPTIVQFAAWPSMRNIVVMGSLPFTIVAYGLGCFYFVGKETYFNNSDTHKIIHALLFIIVYNVFFATTFFVIFSRNSIFLQFLLNLVDRIINNLEFEDSGIAQYWRRYQSVCIGLLVLSILLLGLSYIGMGFIPAFTENPFAAKYFQGAYEERYRPWAPFFRTGIIIYGVLGPYLLFLYKKISFKLKILLILLFVLDTILLLVSLRRGNTAITITYMYLMYFIFWRRGQYAWFGVLSYCAVYIFGAFSNQIILYVLLDRPLGLNIKSIVLGLPDIQDFLWFWDRWEVGHSPPLLGKTFAGALIPYHSAWNIAIITLTTIGVEPGTGGGGGFRIPDAITAALNFGVLGVILFAILQGCWSAIVIRIGRHIVFKDFSSFFTAVPAYFIPLYVSYFFASIILLTLDSVTTLLIDVFILFVMVRSGKLSTSSSATAALSD